MAISSLPIFSSFNDKNHILSVIMQLEIEGKVGTGLDLVKGIILSTEDTAFADTVREMERNVFVLKNDRDLKSFYPSVPTPPPNF